MTRHFGKDYVKKWGVPNCIIKESHSYYELHKKEREEEEAGYSSCSCDCSCSEGSTDEEDVANDCKEVGESGSGNSGTKKKTRLFMKLVAWNMTRAVGRRTNFEELVS